MKIVSIIPARAGSKGILKKNILPLNGHPLIAYSIAISQLSEYIQETIVSTDSKEIIDIARSYSANVPFVRPDNISQDDSLDIEFFSHYFEFLKQNSLIMPDLVVHLRPTTPLREVSVVNGAIKFMINTKEATSLRSATITDSTPYKMFKLENGYAKPFLHIEGKREFYNLPRQYFEDAYIPNGYVDIIRPEVFLNTGLLHGNKIKIWRTDEVPDIDIRADVELALKTMNEDKFRPISDILSSVSLQV